MKHFIYLSMLAFLISCSPAIIKNVDDVKSLYIEYDPNVPNNYQNHIPGRVFAEMKNGERIELKNDKNFKSDSSVIFNFNTSTFKIDQKPATFNIAKVPVSLTLSDKTDYSVQFTDTVQLNFNGGITLLDAHTPLHGAAGKSFGTPLVFRDGKDAENGLPGQPGVDGYRYDIKVWKDQEIYFIKVINTTLAETAYYQIRGLNQFQLNAWGGDGGNGGKGGDGGNGKDAKLKDEKEKDAGRGGNGGNGAQGGNGGRGGLIRCTIHPNAMDFQPFIIFDVRGGQAGKGGIAGKAGRAGTPLSGQTQPSHGNPGMAGQDGLPGVEGYIEIISADFDWKSE